ncbi:MAG: RcnB family protein [Brevundimonas sp.]|uniref:RcnB family protein n=1 Tax=Brevundimonas sp. TaxID=1871086 RepID=UPI00258987FA|nr:RcnB family protein [Brevundimonas sp.]MCV0413838.1 RcnB family protein [Brevundimonas sp.]
MKLRYALSVAIAAATLATTAVAQDGNPPGGRGGRGTNWENPPGAKGGPGTSPDRIYVRDGQRYAFAARPAGYGVFGVSTPSPAGAYQRAGPASHPPRPPSVIIVDRGRPGWWRSQTDFVGYRGPRPGYAYAPGHGYYPIVYRPPGGVWVVGAHYPPTLRRYVVVTPARYGLPPAPPGHGWYYADTSFVLVTHSTGLVTRTVAGGW